MGGVERQESIEAPHRDNSTSGNSPEFDVGRWVSWRVPRRRTSWELTLVLPPCTRSQRRLLCRRVVKRVRVVKEGTSLTRKVLFIQTAPRRGVYLFCFIPQGAGHDVGRPDSLRHNMVAGVDVTRLDISPNPAPMAAELNLEVRPQPRVGPNRPRRTLRNPLTSSVNITVRRWTSNSASRSKERVGR